MRNPEATLTLCEAQEVSHRLACKTLPTMASRTGSAQSTETFATFARMHGMLSNYWKPSLYSRRRMQAIETPANKHCQ